MGNDAPKAKPAPPPPTMEEMILDMKMMGKRFNRESANAEKAKNQAVTKARLAIEKGDDEGAKLFLQQASMKQRESQQMLRMANKLEAMTVMVKAGQSNANMIQQVNQLTPYLNQEAQNMPFEKLYTNIQNFEGALNKITANANVMDQLLTQDQTMLHDQTVENMFQQLKQEQIVKMQNDLLAQNNAAFLNQLQQNTNQNA